MIRGGGQPVFQIRGCTSVPISVIDCNYKLMDVYIVGENRDKGVIKRGTTLDFVYKIDKNVLF